MRAWFRRLAKRIGLPIRAYFNPRFESVQTRLGEVERNLSHHLYEYTGPLLAAVQDTHRLTESVHDKVQGFAVSFEGFQESTGEIASVLGRALDNLTNEAHTIQRSVGDIARQTDRTHEAWVAALPDLARRLDDLPERLASTLAPPDVDVLTTDRAEVLSREVTGTGHASRAGLWFNPPVWVRYGPEGAFLNGVNERIVELPYVLRALANLPTGAKILDIGATESTLALSLASLGYAVTAIDPRPYPLSHPNLQVVVGAVETWNAPEGYDAIVCLSTLEHIGIGAYGSSPSEDADLRAAQRMRALASPGARLVLTAPYGREPSASAHQRVYDDARLAQVLLGWHIEDRVIASRVDSVTWRVQQNGDSGNPPAGDEQVVMITATAPRES